MNSSLKLFIIFILFFFITGCCRTEWVQSGSPIRLEEEFNWEDRKIVLEEGDKVIIFTRDSRKVSMTVTKYNSTSLFGYVTFFSDLETPKYEFYGATENLQEIQASNIDIISRVTEASPGKRIEICGPPRIS